MLKKPKQVMNLILTCRASKKMKSVLIWKTVTLPFRLLKALIRTKKIKKGTYIRRERYAGAMTRSFYVGSAVTEEDIKAKYEDGILSLSIPKKDPKAVEAKKYIAIEGK